MNVGVILVQILCCRAVPWCRRFLFEFFRREQAPALRLCGVISKNFVALFTFAENYDIMQLSDKYGYMMGEDYGCKDFIERLERG